MKIIMLGAPGAGKGTQAKKIADKYQIPHVSTGDIFRFHIKEGTDLGKKAKEYMDQGMLVPDELTIGMLLDRISQADCENGYVLDGFPRTIPQAEKLDEALSEKGDQVDYAIDVDDIEEAVSYIREKGYAIEEPGIYDVPSFGSPDCHLNVAFFHGPNGERVELFVDIGKK